MKRKSVRPVSLTLTCLVRSHELGHKDQGGEGGAAREWVVTASVAVSDVVVELGVHTLKSCCLGFQGVVDPNVTAEAKYRSLQSCAEDFPSSDILRRP